VRDATVALEVVRGLLESEKKPARRTRLLELRRVLHAQRQSAREALRAATSSPASRTHCRTQARRAEYGAFRWRTRRCCARASSASPQGTQGAEAGRAPRTRSRCTNQRKQVRKYLQQALAVVADGGSRSLRKLEKRAGVVAERLGNDHDLAMLEAKLAALPARSKAQRKLIARIEARRARLQKKALKLARRMYRRKAAAFVDRVLAG
jgi:hypothetical protein